MNIPSNKIKVGKKFVAVLRCQYGRQTRNPIDFFAVFLLKPKVIELLCMSCGKNMFWGLVKTLTQIGTGTGAQTDAWEPVY